MNAFDLRKIEPESVKTVFLSIYKALKDGESITFLDQNSLDWINNEIHGINVTSEKIEKNLWSANLSKTTKRECCGMCS